MSEGKIQCQYFVLKKKRLCRMTVKAGESYCGEHIDHSITAGAEQETPETEKDSRQRVPCPYDNNHTCFKSHLQKHMAKCNSKPSESTPPYISPSVNRGPPEDEVPRVRLNDVLDTELLDLIKRTEEASQNLVELQERIREHPALDEEIKRPDLGAPSLKHLLQNSSLISLMEDHSLLKDDTCFLEMGAGKGKLTYWLAQAAKELKNCKFALVDISTYRNKSENKIETDSEVIRVRADVADLCLGRVPFHEGCKFAVPISKHLCGAATDFALRCVGNSLETSIPCEISGLVMALCCHHRCEWQHYVGKEFFKKIGLSSRDFSVMCVLVSWATCGVGRTRQPEEQPTTSEENPHKDRYDRLNLPRETREEIGKRCKLLIDQGRVEYLKSIGLSSELVYYVKQNVTLENVCLLAWKESK